MDYKPTTEAKNNALQFLKDRTKGTFEETLKFLVHTYSQREAKEFIKLQGSSIEEQKLIFDNLPYAIKTSLNFNKLHIRIRTFNSHTIRPLNNSATPKSYEFGFNLHATNWDLNYEFDFNKTTFKAKVVCSYF